MEFDAQTVYQENYAKQDGSSAHSNGFGDSYLFLRYCALEEKGWLPHITGLFQLKMPTGKYENADPDELGTDLMGATSGGGSWDQGIGINLTKKFKPFIFHADTIYSFPQRVSDSNINYLTISHGIGWSNDKIQALIAYQRVITGTNTDANDSVAVTFVYTF